jgi:hypothetical protein
VQAKKQLYIIIRAFGLITFFKKLKYRKYLQQNNNNGRTERSIKNKNKKYVNHLAKIT